MRGISKITNKGEDDRKERVQVMAAEERATGGLKWTVIWQYITAVNSWCIIFTVLLVVLLTQASATTTDYWLSFW